MKIFKTVGNWLSRAWSGVTGLWSKLDKKADQIVPVAVTVVQAVKKAIESETFEVVKEIVKNTIPGTVDDAIIDKAVSIAEKNIPVIAIQLEIIKAISETEGTPEQMKASLIALKNVFGDKWEKFTTGLAQSIIEAFSDGKCTGAEAYRLAKEYYDEYVKK